MMFDSERNLQILLSFRHENGAFRAGDGDYDAFWWRDQLICAWALYSAGLYDMFLESMQLVFTLLERHWEKFERDGFFHAKYHAVGLHEIESDHSFGHYQTDWKGLFFFLLGSFEDLASTLLQDGRNREILQAFVRKLAERRVWEQKDHGWWEGCFMRRSSSIGPMVAGFQALRRSQPELVPEHMIEEGWRSLRAILPYESRDNCGNPNHWHCCDAAQLAFIWPYGMLHEQAAAKLYSRIVFGHSENGAAGFHRLLGNRGLIRYWHDWYYAEDGVSPHWTLFNPWLALVCLKLGMPECAEEWWRCSIAMIPEDGRIPELITASRQMIHQPLTMAHAMMQIACHLLPAELREKAESELMSF